jgi:single-stranded-DNA-specific exonuclease
VPDQPVQEFIPIEDSRDDSREDSRRDRPKSDVTADLAAPGLAKPASAAPHLASQRQIPRQRWQIFPAQRAQAKQIAQATALSPLLAQVLINRGIYTAEQAWEFLDPETLLLPSPLDDFPDLIHSLDLLVAAIESQQKILICGDYDADGMTSTALLMRSLRYLGAQVDYAIPSRMAEGYGINQRIVEDFHKAGGSLILTVDNGIAAYEPIARARELGLVVILTDHHEVPDKLPPANAILNPKLISETSPYRGVAGVGVAYILAVCLAQRMNQMQDLTATLLALFTLGTIADLAPLTGVNRRWVKRGLKLLSKSRIPGVQALIEVAGLSEETALKPEAIGFRLGPRINAVGRIADPQIVIDLLTTDDIGVALERAMQCEEANKQRQQMCETIEAQAVEWVEAQREKGLLNFDKERVLLIVQPDWHHGVIGIVASRLVERYGVPVFIGTYEDKSKKEIRGSARSIPEFNVFEALQFCDDLLDRYGGHRAAGGFSFPGNKLRQVRSRLGKFARQHLQPEHLKPLVIADVQAELADANLALYSQIDRIHPCGIENPDPVFWTANVTLAEQRIIGKTNSHLKLTFTQLSAGGEGAGKESTVIKAIAWRWGNYYPLPRALDIAYKLRLNEWNGERNVELELVGVREATSTTADTAQQAQQASIQPAGIQPWTTGQKPLRPQMPVSGEAPESPVIQAAREIALDLQRSLTQAPEAANLGTANLGTANLETANPETANPEAANPEAANPEAANPEANSVENGNLSASSTLEIKIAKPSSKSARAGLKPVELPPVQRKAAPQAAVAKKSVTEESLKGLSEGPSSAEPLDIAGPSVDDEKKNTAGKRSGKGASKRSNGRVSEATAPDLFAGAEVSAEQAIEGSHEASLSEFSAESPEEFLDEISTQSKAADPSLFSAPSLIATIADSDTDSDTDSGSQVVEFYYGQRRYKGLLDQSDELRRLSIENAEGHLLRVQLSDRQGLLYVPGEPPQAIDIGEMKYFNLIRAGLSALEVRQKNQLLLKKDDLLAEKDRQIATLKAQIELLEEKISQLSAEQQRQFAVLETERQAQEDTIQDQEAHIELLQEEQLNHAPLLDTASSATQVQQQVRESVGDSVWFCLQPASQQDLQAAQQAYLSNAVAAQSKEGGDCAKAGQHLSTLIEREVLTPFWQDFQSFLRTQGVDHTLTDGSPLSLSPQVSISQLPPLLSDQWKAFTSEQLAAPSLTEAGVTVTTCKAPQPLSPSERALMTQFLGQWDHPMATCLSQKARQAAASLAQIGQLCTLAKPNGESQSRLYPWQYELLYRLLAGQNGKGGLLRQIFAVS